MGRARAPRPIVATILSVLLAAVFVAAALPKLIGSDPVILEATAVREFPAWIRTLDGDDPRRCARREVLVSPAATGGERCVPLPSSSPVFRGAGSRSSCSPP